MDKFKLPPAIITICLDPQSLPDMVHYAWDQSPAEAEALPLSLAKRLNWSPQGVSEVSADISPDTLPDRARFLAGTARPEQSVDRFGGVSLDVMDTHSADEALDLLQLLRFDLAILGENKLGDETAELIKKIKLVSPATRCIVVTPAMNPHREREIRETGVLAILDGPLPFSQLREVVGHVTANR